jgi:hypothetical protein
VAVHTFQASPVWIYTQSTSQTLLLKALIKHAKGWFFREKMNS